MQYQLISTNTIVLFLFFLLLSSCSKRTVDLETLKHEQRVTTALDSSSTSKLKVSTERRMTSIRMMQSGYQVLIKPKGTFTFSQDKGFHGEAESISINGASTSTENIQSQLKQELDSSGKSSFKKKTDSLEKDSSKVKHTKASGLSWWIIPGMVLVAIVLWVITPFSKIRIWLLSNLKLKKREG